MSTKTRRVNVVQRLGSLAMLAGVLAGCGGGGGGDPAPASPATGPLPPSTPQPSLPQPSTPQPSTPPPQPNQNPVVVKPIIEVGGSGHHPFRYDASQGGETFSDPDGDSLTYTLEWRGGLESSDGPWLFLPPDVQGNNRLVYVRIIARDGRGGEASHWFWVDLPWNQSPTVQTLNSAVFPSPGEQVSRDLSQGGMTFADLDGDPLTYTVEMTSPPGRGFSLQGLTAVGSLAPLSVASFKITASDGYGGTTTDAFVVATPAPPPGEPALPATTFVYDDAELPLPWLFRRSFTHFTPFWDTGGTQSRPPTNTGATLGRVLFYDKRLSILNTHSCGSCHEQSLGFTTAQRFPSGVLGIPLKRNAMALANTRYNLFEQYFWDLRVGGLERLVLMPIEDPAELGNLLPLLEQKLAATTFYPRLFEAAFGTPEITRERISHALSEFLRSIVTYRSRFDQAFLQLEEPPASPPDPAQFLTAPELRGAELFESSSCTRCHTTELQTMDGGLNNGLDAVPVDLGAGNGAFRAPSLRNVAVSAPYMHDGRFATLRAVIDHYDHGVVDSPLVSIRLRGENFDGPVRRLNLSEDDKNALEAFLGTLTDTALLADPKFADPF